MNKITSDKVTKSGSIGTVAAGEKTKAGNARVESGRG